MTDGVQRATVDSTGDQDPSPDDSDSTGGSPDRPDWLPEKFDSPEEMAESYSELESKLGSGGGDDSTDDSSDDMDDVEPEDLRIKEAEEDAEFDFESLGEELAENGELSEDTYESFEDQGIPRRILDNYVEGLAAKARESMRRMADVTGGRENLNAVLEWASNNVSREQIEAYNNYLESGQLGQAELALRGITQQYQESEGIEPSLVRGESTGSSSGVKPFKSSSEVTEAMSDPRYKTDPAYRQKVADRLAASEVF